MQIAVGVLLITTSSAFKKVVETEGNDVEHLMSALNTFSTALTIRCVAAILGCIGLLLIAAASLLR